MNDAQFHVETLDHAGKITGADTAILRAPTELYVEIDGEKAINVRWIARFLRLISEKFAADINEKLHHAEWILTTNPATVEAHGIVHDCEDCRAGVRAALRQMAEHPEEEIFVGQLYWTQ
jgi:hypothetical protein